MSEPIDAREQAIRDLWGGWGPKERAEQEREMRWLHGRGKSVRFLARWSHLPPREVRRILAAAPEAPPARQESPTADPDPAP